MPKADIYFEKSYGETCESIEEGLSEIFRYEDQNGVISHHFIKRLIPIKIGEKDYYDIITPYGYGGPIIENYNDDKAKLVRSFSEKFSQYCSDNNIVSEFIRFHPLVRNYLDFNLIYKTSFMRKTVGTDLTRSEHPELSEFSKSCKKTIRRAYKNDLSFEIVEQPTNLDSFHKIYTNTMDRKSAEDFYYFPKIYFEGLIQRLSTWIINANVYHEETCIASGVYFAYYPYIHAHLSASLDEYLHFSPAYILKDIIVKWGKERSFSVVHYGGGTSNAPNDPLLTFKKKFSGETEFDFFVGKKVYMPSVYEALVQKKGATNETFFPAYRAKKSDIITV